VGYQQFGWDVDMGGGTAVIGTRSASDGSASVFRRIQGSWIFEQALTSNESNYGLVVAADGDVVAVGVPDQGASVGLVYVYRYDGNAWVLEQTLLASDGETGDRFGSAIAVDGHQMIIGTGDIALAPFVNKAYIYRWTGDNWVEDQKLVPEVGDTTAFFGLSVAISGNWALVGAAGDDVDGYPHASGSASFYQRSGGAWTFRQKVFPQGDEHQFGFDLDLSGHSAIVGHYNQGDWAYVFVRSGNTWFPEQKLTPGDGLSGIGYGRSVAIENDIVLIGAPFVVDGSVYQYCWDGSSWGKEQKHSGGALSERYGLVVALDGDSGITGAPDSDLGGPLTDAGFAFFFGFGTALKVPLGGSLAGVEDPGSFKVYVPTKWGGKLTVATDDGVVADLRYPDGTLFVNGTEIGNDRHGWFTFQVSGSTAYTVTTQFVQEGISSTIPWNFFYFPYKEGTSPNLYDDPGACTKFDDHFGLNDLTTFWEDVNHRTDAATWVGHCGGATAASILLEPLPTDHPVGFTQDELEGLGAMFFREQLSFNRLIARFSNKSELRVATPADTDEVDCMVDRFHNGLRDMLREERKAFFISFRQPTTDPGPVQIWNYACYRYAATFEEDPNAFGDEESQKVLQVHVTNNFFCNEDFVDANTKSGVSAGNPVSDPAYRRDLRSEYALVYTQDGKVQKNGKLGSRKQNWLSMELVKDFSQTYSPPQPIFVPWTMVDLAEAAERLQGGTPVAGSNPFVTSDLLIQLGFALRTEYQ
jgi:FG-GAP repeat